LEKTGESKIRRVKGANPFQGGPKKNQIKVFKGKSPGKKMAMRGKSSEQGTIFVNKAWNVKKGARSKWGTNAQGHAMSRPFLGGWGTGADTRKKTPVGARLIRGIKGGAKGFYGPQRGKNMGELWVRSEKDKNTNGRGQGEVHDKVGEEVPESPEGRKGSCRGERPPLT